MGVARVPDARVDRLVALFSPKKTTTASFEVVDLAGITKGERAAFDAKEFRSADALLHVVRAFPGADGGPATPRADVVDLETELILADLEVVERRLERLEASLKKKPNPLEQKEQAVLQRLRPELEAETPLRAVSLTEDEARLDPRLHLPLAEAHPPLPEPGREGDRARGHSGRELRARRPRGPAGHALRLGLRGDRDRGRAARRARSRRAFLADLGLAEPAIRRVLTDCYALLGLISFFTVGEDEVRAWPVPRGTRAQDAAGAIHSDIARGFIRAEVVGYDELIAAEGSMATVRERGAVPTGGQGVRRPGRRDLPLPLQRREVAPATPSFALLLRAHRPEQLLDAGRGRRAGRN